MIKRKKDTIAVVSSHKPVNIMAFILLGYLYLVNFWKFQQKFEQLILDNWLFYNNQNNIFSACGLFFKTDAFFIHD